MSANPTDLPPDSERDHILRERLLISVDELATILRVSPRTVWRLLSAEKLIPPVRFGGAVRWRYGDVKQWIDGGCPPNSKPNKPR
jgi:excisionase family DNA binding protein